MFKLVKLGVLPSRFLDLKDDVPLFASCMFETSRIRQCITKGKKSGSIRKGTDHNPGDGVSVDQIHSDNPGLVPQFSGKLTSARIWDSQVMVDHFSDLTYLYLMRSKIQEDNLAGK